MMALEHSALSFLSGSSIGRKQLASYSYLYVQEINLRVMFKQLLIEHNRLRLTFGLFRPMASSLRLIPPKIDLERMYFMQRAPASTVALSPTLILPDPKRTRDGSTAETWRGSRSRRRKRNLWIKLSYGVNFFYDPRVHDIECHSLFQMRQH